MAPLGFLPVHRLPCMKGSWHEVPLTDPGDHPQCQFANYVLPLRSPGPHHSTEKRSYQVQSGDQESRADALFSGKKLIHPIKNRPQPHSDSLRDWWPHLPPPASHARINIHTRPMLPPQQLRDGERRIRTFKHRNAPIALRSGFFSFHVEDICESWLETYQKRRAHSRIHLLGRAEKNKHRLYRGFHLDGCLGTKHNTLHDLV
mmetsp:Transcript_532/g.1585  ORF Transcript_532/g.1585 Transcript_532/m.1585 type:complete len:203 (-) Transcript_532:999-1607(-)